MLLKDVTSFLGFLASFSLQENYDNSGVLLGSPDLEITGIIVSLDITELVVDEAIRTGSNLIVSHHPFIFQGIKKINTNNWVHRTLIKAIKSDIAIIAIHTNLDNVLTGVNGRIAESIGLHSTEVLQPKDNILRKLVVFVPETHHELVRRSLFEAGAGSIGNYDECSFNTSGVGTFRAINGAKPFVGELNKPHFEKEMRIEVVFPYFLYEKLIAAMRKVHPYEEIAFDVFALGNNTSEFGSGIIGELQQPEEEADFLKKIAKIFQLKMLRHTPLSGKKVKKIAVCGGAGIFLLPKAINSGADVFITADVKYHDFFEADGKIILADIGHFESEQFTIDLLCEQLLQKFPTFAVRKTKIITNPVKYYPD
jgi:dinuclear metal center YbgI/SA1388 family protein